METIKLSKFEAAQVKNLAKSVNGLLAKRAKLQEKIQKITAEIAEVDELIAGWDMPIKKMTANKGQELGITDLVVRTVVNIGTDKKTGKPIMASKYNIKPEYLEGSTKEETIEGTENDPVCHATVLEISSNPETFEGLDEVPVPENIETQLVEDEDDSNPFGF